MILLLFLQKVGKWRPSPLNLSMSNIARTYLNEPLLHLFSSKFIRVQAGNPKAYTLHQMAVSPRPYIILKRHLQSSTYTLLYAKIPDFMLQQHTVLSFSVFLCKGNQILLHINISQPLTIQNNMRNYYKVPNTQWIQLLPCSGQQIEYLSWVFRSTSLPNYLRFIKCISLLSCFTIKMI